MCHSHRCYTYDYYSHQNCHIFSQARSSLIVKCNILLSSIFYKFNYAVVTCEIKLF